MLSETNRTSRRILVADDDPVMRRVVQRILTDQGYAVVVANDGREAYRMLQTDADFRAAIFDLKMPHLEGMDIIRYMTKQKLDFDPGTRVYLRAAPEGVRVFDASSGAALN